MYITTRKASTLYFATVNYRDQHGTPIGAGATGRTRLEAIRAATARFYATHGTR